MKDLRLPLLLTSLVLIGAPSLALAQQQAGQGEGNDPAKRDAAIEQRFKAADKDGDGKLTKDEAEAGMPRVFKHFDELDKDHKGYLTLDDVKAARGQRRGGQQ